MSFIREPCDDGTHCYNNMAHTSFGTECIQDVCKVLTGNMCNHDVDCALDSDICVDQKCTATQCNCASYQDCVDYECKSKPCSATPDCLIHNNENGGYDASFCFENYCHPLASFGGQCGISSDCGEEKASCIDGICAIEKRAKAVDKNVGDGGNYDDHQNSSFGTGFISGFLAASFIGFGIWFEYKTRCISECFHNIFLNFCSGRMNFGMVAVPVTAALEGEVVCDNEYPTAKQIQLSAIT